MADNRIPPLEIPRRRAAAEAPPADPAVGRIHRPGHRTLHVRLRDVAPERARSGEANR